MRVSSRFGNESGRIDDVVEGCFIMTAVDAEVHARAMTYKSFFPTDLHLPLGPSERLEIYILY
jgi:hypothetical protein